MGVETDKARHLLALLKDIPLAGFDRSFKMTEKLLLGHRFLLGVRKEHIEADRLWGICAGMGMPGEYAAAFADALPNANTVHFGFEENENGCVYKVYLEFWARLNEHIHSNETGGALLHLAFKWDALDDSKRAVARYVCHPHLSVADILGRMSAIYGSHPDKTSCEIAQDIVKLAAATKGFLDRRGIHLLTARDDREIRPAFDPKVPGPVQPADVRRLERTALA